MARSPRNYAAEYRARKARLARERTTLYQRRNAEARRRGYASLNDQRVRRKAGDLTHADVAGQAKRDGGRYVTDLGGGRWTFATPTRPAYPGLTRIDRYRLQQTMDRAWRADTNITITATWKEVGSNRTGTAQAGGDYGIRVRSIHDEGADALESIENALANSTGSELPPATFITSLNLFLFPAIGRAAA